MRRLAVNTRSLGMAAIFIALNVVGAKIANTLGLPFYLDTIGTILAGILLPLPIALIVAVGSSGLSSLVNFPGDIWFVGTQLAIALLAWAANRFGMFRSLVGALAAGVIIAVVSAAVSAPVVLIVFQGVTVPGVTAVTGLFLAAGRDLVTSVVTGTLVTASLDKVLSAVLAYLIVSRLPPETLSRFGIRP